MCPCTDLLHVLAAVGSGERMRAGSAVGKGRSVMKNLERVGDQCSGGKMVEEKRDEGKPQVDCFTNEAAQLAFLLIKCLGPVEEGQPS